MTAEIAIANSGAVALAADSAVTIGGQKIYNSALKLFALSKVAPVGVMIYGNANLMAVPWEPLIKSYRQQLLGKKYDKLTDYADDFIKYLNNNKIAFPRDIQLEWLQQTVGSFFAQIRHEFSDEVRAKFRDGDGEISEAETKQILTEIINNYHELLKSEKFSVGMKTTLFTTVRKKHLPLFKTLREQVFEQARMSRSVIKKLYDLAAYRLVKKVPSNGVTGLVIAGYGEEEIYPSIITYEVDGVVENKLKYHRDENKCRQIGSKIDCTIIPFAQEDMVNTFMGGVNPKILEFLHGYLPKLFQRLPELLDGNGIPKTKVKKFNSQTSQLLSDFFGTLKEHINKEHAHPVFRMASSLPKDELASMAESLVNLTAFKRRITDSMETVGGPVDVLVISKGDGLVWVKRKHYFPPELNQHFFSNYFRGIENGK